eukprot:CAMPEP_0194299642 /NCGR_PEP_ID=MMETSP0169-20130528/60825_1 /TAXON_ID=218684 /ORGANISM="Corethron pennatum, Strain L29A3" /LENGTH=538 /DNA_ID=CAMNT_0039049747 /DNA_START=163 /DNA_END=1779 /DNA_ORIENTATION=-
MATFFELTPQDRGKLFLNCPDTCGVCQTIPSQVPSSIEIDECQDIPAYRDKFGSPCKKYIGLACEKMLNIGYMVNEVIDLMNNCPWSCGECTSQPSSLPSMVPSMKPSILPTHPPSVHPTSYLSVNPSKISSKNPSDSPSFFPLVVPSMIPSPIPSSSPSKKTPSSFPTTHPTLRTTQIPSKLPTIATTTRQSITPLIINMSRFEIKMSQMNRKIFGTLLTDLNDVIDHFFKNTFTISDVIKSRITFRTNIISQELTPEGELTLSMEKNLIYNPENPDSYSFTTDILDIFVKLFFDDAYIMSVMSNHLKIIDPYIFGQLDTFVLIQFLPSNTNETAQSISDVGVNLSSKFDADKVRESKDEADINQIKKSDADLIPRSKEIKDLARKFPMNIPMKSNQGVWAGIGILLLVQLAGAFYLYRKKNFREIAIEEESCSSFESQTRSGDENRYSVGTEEQYTSLRSKRMENIRNKLNDQPIPQNEPQEMDTDIILESQDIKMEHSFTKDIPYRDGGLMGQITDYAYDVHQENATYDSPWERL